MEEDAKPEIDKLKLILHTSRNNLSQNEEVTIELFKGGSPIWEELSRSDIDIVCIPLVLDRNRFLFVTIGDDLIDSSNLKIGFERIFVMGYPYGWYDTLNNLPITMIGHLSSPFGVPFRGNPFMLGHIETHPEMSGSPVFIHLKDYVSFENNRLVTHLGASKFLLVGVFSG
jgi:hypothetical protein